MKKILFVIGFSFLFLNSSIAQLDPVEGDFRAATDGNWNDFYIWEIFKEGSWQANVTDTFPGKENTVYLQENTDVVLDSSAVCYNLHIHEGGQLDLDTAKLEVWGFLRFYDGPDVPGTNLILPPNSPGTWISSEEEGKLVFRGNTNRTLVTVGSGGTSEGLSGYNVEIAFDKGIEASLEEDFRFGNLTVSSGIFTVNSAHLLAGHSTGASGNIALMDSVVFNPPSVGIYRTASLPLESFVLDSLAILNLSTDNFILAAQNLELTGSVIVEETGFMPLNLPTNGSIIGAEPVDNYGNLYIGGITQKNLSGDININGLLTLTDADLSPNGFDLSYGEFGGLEYKGSDAVLSSDFEFPQVDGPANLIISNPNVSLHADRTLLGQLTLNEGILGLGNFDLTLGANSPLILGEFSETNFIALEGSGTLIKTFTEAGSFVFPIGERQTNTDFTPAAITVNSGNFAPDSFISVGLTEGKHPDNISATSFINRYWSLQTNITDLNISGSFLYTANDVFAPENSINTYYYDQTTAVSVGSIDKNQRMLKFANFGVSDSDFEITGANHCNIEQNITFVPHQEYCGSVDLAPMVWAEAIASPVVPITYQWEMRKNEGVWTEVTGEVSKDYDPAEITEAGFYEIRRVAKADGCGIPHYSSTISFNLFPAIANNGFTLLDIDEYCLIGTGFTFSGEVPTGGDGSYTFQWERKKGEGAFVVVGSDTSYIEADLLTPGNYLFRRGVVSGPCTIDYSDSSLVRVYSAISDNIVTASTLQYCDIPSYIKITGSTHSGGGDIAQYTWERRIDGGVFEAIGGDTQNLVDTDILVTGEYQYKRTITSFPCGFETSNTITVYVYPPLGPNIITKEEEIYCGTATGFEIEGSEMTGGDGNYGYDWYRKKDNGASEIVATSGVNYTEDESLAPGVYQYFRKVVSAACNINSDILSVTVLPLITNNQLTTPDVVEYCGIPSEISIEGSMPTGGDGTYSYVWERSIDEGVFTAVGTSQDLLDEVITLTGKYEYLRKVISGSCDPVVSDTVIIIIYPELTENSLSLTELNYCSNPTGFTIEAVDMTGGDGSYESVWERSYEGGEYDTVKNNAAEDVVAFIDSYMETEVLIPGTYTYKRTVTSAVCMNFSNVIEVVVEEPLSNNILDQPEGLGAIYCGEANGLVLTGSLPEGGDGVYNYVYERRYNGGDWIILDSEEKDLTESRIDVPGVYDYRRVVSTSVCNEIISNEITITITEPLVITPTITGNTGSDMNGSIELVITGGLPPYEYLWTTAEFTKDIHNLVGGEYSVAVYDQSGCEVSQTFIVPQILGLEESPNVQSHKLYPNPVKESLNIEVDFNKPLPYEIFIVNSMGKVVKSISAKASEEIDRELNMAAYPSGIYIVKIIADGKAETWKFIKK